MNHNQFRTIVSVPKAPVLINPGHRVLFIGSCFAGNMGKFMGDARFPVSINPFGVLYNPFSIGGALQSLMNKTIPEETDLVFYNGLWHSFFHHGSFSNPEPSEVIAKVSEATLTGHQFLKNASFAVITFGTAYVYEHTKLQRVVANCHKFPENDFNRYLLDVDDIVDAYKDLIVQLRVFNPELNIIFSVSPVRHLKDGAHGNQLSKAVLLLAVEQLTMLFEKVWYFPAYEIVLDELRDYRFYDEVMTQPNEMAVKYIWNRFVESTFSKEAQSYNKEIQKIISARNHRSSGFVTPEYRLFLQNTLELIHSLSARYPQASLESDREFFQQKLNSFFI